MTDSLNKVHVSFKLNGISYDPKELKELAFRLVKEGPDHENEIGDFLLDWLSDSDTIVVSTSGSTGPPKKIRIRKSHMRNSAISTADFIGLTPGETALLCLPMNYIAGKMMMVRALILGLDLNYVVPSSSPLKGTVKQFDFCAMIPMQLKNDINHIERVNKLLVGGAPVPEELKRAISKKNNYIYETFGMTETISHIAMRTLSREETGRNFKTLKNVSIAVDHRSCLVIKAPGLGADEVITNDVVTLESPTEFRWMGRFDNAVNSGGVKLYPESIEEKLDAVIAGRFFLTGIRDEVLGEKLVLIVEGKHDTSELSSKIQRLKTLHRYEIPKEIFTLAEFAVTTSGKINRKETIKKLNE